MATSEPLYYCQLDHLDWPLIIAVSEKGFCFTGSLHKDKEEAVQWLDKTGRNGDLIHSPQKAAVYTDQLNDYFEGKRHSFTVPADVSGTPFQQAVWKALLEIPYGETRTYSEIAKKIQKPQAIRAVASAVGKNPALIFIPCHRVIHKNGSISGFRGSDEMKKRLLSLEKETVKNSRRD